MPHSLISLNDIELSFNRGTVNESPVFKGFSFSVDKGEFVSVVGSNGSGKTTMLNLICGSLSPDSGNIMLDGKDITGMPEYKRARRIGRVFQDPSKGSCPSLSVLENLCLAENKGKAFGLSRAIEPKKKDGYKELLSWLGLGLEDKLDTAVGSLSGGQRQALALVLATLTPIELLVLDEHTAALDPKASETVMELTLKLIEEGGLTALMVTHNLRFAVDYGSRVVMMHEGKSVLDSYGKDKSDYRVDDLLELFNEISIECGN